MTERWNRLSQDKGQKWDAFRGLGKWHICWSASGSSVALNQGAFLAKPFWSLASWLGKARSWIRAHLWSAWALPSSGAAARRVLTMGGADPGSSNHQQHLGMSAQGTWAPGSGDSLPFCTGKSSGVKPSGKELLSLRLPQH